MADVYTRIGYIKGATGAQGERGLQGDPGDAATIQVGTVTTVPYGQTANVVNSGTESAAVFDFTIPQGRPGQETTDMQNLTLGSITTSSASFPIPAVGETGKVLWGKVVKWFSDMSALVASKFDASNVVNNLTTTSSGYALDARQANPNVSGSMGAKLNALETAVGNFCFRKFSVPGRSSATISAPSGSRHILFFISTNRATTTMAVLGVNSAGSVEFLDINPPASPQYTVNTSTTNQITISNASNVGFQAVDFVVVGNPLYQ